MAIPSQAKGLRTWIEIDTAAIAANYAAMRLHAPKAKMMGVVKSNAYGHGLVAFSKELEKLSIDWLAVDSVVEGLRLREEGVTIPILVLGYTLPELIGQAAEKNISLTASTFEFLDACASLKKPVNIHLKVDTGLHRQGFLKNQMPEVMTKLTTLTSSVRVEGLFTHFAKAKDPNDRSYTEAQITEFKLWIDTVKNAGYEPLIHACATAGTLLYPQAHFDMVRIGAGLYGIWPSPQVKASLAGSIHLKPVLAWRTIIAEQKNLPAGAGIGYDLSEKLSRQSTVAICPIGYWHGFARGLSSIGAVLVEGTTAKILGRIAMDMTEIDITGVPDAHVGSVVTLIGTDRSNIIETNNLAAKLQTTEYEILTRLNPLIERIYAPRS